MAMHEIKKLKKKQQYWTLHTFRNVQMRKYGAYFTC